VGHATDRAVILGLAGSAPTTTTPRRPRPRSPASARKEVAPGTLGPFAFDPERDLIFDYGPPLPGHANGMILMATDAQGDVILQETYYSVGGGFVLTAAELPRAGTRPAARRALPVPQRGRDARDVRAGGPLHRGAQARERADPDRRGRSRPGLDRIWEVMTDCIDRGLATPASFPAG
jgi:L-serine dehydratase